MTENEPNVTIDIVLITYEFLTKSQQANLYKIVVK